MKRNSLYLSAILAFGKEKQKIKVLEELGELSVEVAKMINGIGDEERLVDEIADVEIMLEQLKIMYVLTKRVYRRKEYKKARLEKKINEIARNLGKAKEITDTLA